MEKVAPHGLLGQSYDGDAVGTNGAINDYNPPNRSVVVALAMAEGGIEGEAADYEMNNKYSIHYKCES